MSQTQPIDGWSCPVPLQDFPHIVMGHGGGGKLSADLFEHLIRPAFDNSFLRERTDAAILPEIPGRLAMSADSFVVRPLFFPGGSIGDLAINGTINDLAMMGAIPRYLSVSFILEEGLPLGSLARILRDMAQAARKENVAIVTGDTKVVERSRESGCLIHTTGIGSVPDGVDLSAKRIEVGDVVLLSGSIADHGIAILGQREGFQFESEIASDTAALSDLVHLLLKDSPVRMLRDPTRGGVAASLNEISAACGHGIEIRESAIRVKPAVRHVCEMLGLDPLTVANEGKLLAIVPAAHAGRALETLQSHPLGREASCIGSVVAAHPGHVVERTVFGSTRLIPLPAGDLLPRIC